MELEVIGLTRDIPASVRWMASSLIARLSRGTLATSLRQTRDEAAVPSGRLRASASCGLRVFREANGGSGKSAATGGGF